MNERSRAQRIHCRFELLVALLVVVGVTLVLSSADSASASAGSDPAEPAPAPAEAQLPSSGEQTPPTDPAPAPQLPAEEPAPAAGEPAPATTGEDAPAPQPASTRERAAAGPRINSAKASPSRIFLGGRRQAAFRFRLGGRDARGLLVKVVKVSTDSVKKRFRLGRVSPGEWQRVAWNGRFGGHDGFVGNGEYAFRVYSAGERAAVTRGSESQRFDFYENRFPLRGRHTYGDGFGAGRGHQGQDVFAACGTRVVAARSGRVQTKAYHSAAGYYVVIDGRGTGQDYVYMHMRRGDRPREGTWVHTGEPIGRESDTGDATGCHLHFELWTSPGWYEGGQAKSPTASLRRWDRWS